MNMIRSSFTNWHTFKIGPHKFLCLELDNKWHIFDETHNNYGSWMTIENFKKKYLTGENLVLCQGT